jgi:dihydropteroate synthase
VPLADGRELSLGPRTLVMGILNITPDSFSDGGRLLEPARAVEAGLRLEAEGADLLDIGGESTRPGAMPVNAEEELARVVPVIRGLAGQVRVPLSIDTSKARVAAAALDAGAALVNDISGLAYDPELARVVAARRVPVVLMHMRGRPQAMYEHAHYASIVDDVARELEGSVQKALDAGVARDAIILDPGLGFAKGADHSLEVLAHLDAERLASLDRPWLLGVSRKSFLTAATGDLPAPERDWPTAAAVTAAVLLGAHIVRVHRVREMVQVVRVADAVGGRRDRDPGA